jgi:hypothetical protein
MAGPGGVNLGGGRLAGHAELGEQDRMAVSYTELLVNVGCHADAHEQPTRRCTDSGSGSSSPSPGTASWMG